MLRRPSQRRSSKGVQEIDLPLVPIMDAFVTLIAFLLLVTSLLAVTLIDSNRGWSLIGGRNQVNRYTDILHAAEAGAGWRTFARKTSLSYWSTDMGAVTEMGREGLGVEGPLRAIYHVDSARCLLTSSSRARRADAMPS